MGLVPARFHLHTDPERRGRLGYSRRGEASSRFFADEGGPHHPFLFFHEFAEPPRNAMEADECGERCESAREVIDLMLRGSVSIPVIICTATPPASTSGLDPAIVKAVIRKPFDIDDFVAVIQAHS